jgi:UDP-N-acetylmuramate--alanine ligase
MDLDLIYNVYFLGIGGIGMSALARYFHTMGKYVAGYDLSSSSITDTLIHLGIPVHFKEDIDSIDERFHEKERTLIVLTPAVPETHAELKFFKENGYAILKRSEILGMLFNNKHGIAIAGTHGKTTVTSMTAYIIDCSDVGCNAFLGGILKNINSNLILNPFGNSFLK